MIEGNELISKEELLRIVSPIDVYRWYLGYDIKPNKLYSSPFRRDSDPSFGIVLWRGTLIYKDFGDNRYAGDCIRFVQQLYGVSYKEAKSRILKDIKPSRRVEIIKEKKPTIIQIQPRKFNSDDIAYWRKYGLDVSDLVSENVYSVEKLYVNKKSVVTEALCFAYLFTNGIESYLKIYQPFNKRCKWLSNVPVKSTFNLDKLEHQSDVITLAKSKKDKMVLKKLISDIYECQKEGSEVITDELDGYFNDNYNRKVCFFDNDEPGKRASISLNSRGYGWVNIPNEYMGIAKDPSDFVALYGYQELEKLLMKKGYHMKDNNLNI